MGRELECAKRDGDQTEAKGEDCKYTKYHHRHDDDYSTTPPSLETPQPDAMILVSLGQTRRPVKLNTGCRRLRNRR